MYRNGVEQETFPTFLNLNGLNLKCFPDLYSETSTLTSPSISPTSSSSASTSGSSASMTQLAPPSALTTTITISEQHKAMMGASALGSVGSGAAGLPMASYGDRQNMLLHQQHLLQQQHQHLLHQQQQLAAAAVAQQQLALAAAASNQQHDEISKSLKMFAMLTAYKAGNGRNEPSAHLQAPVDAIMQDFASNGYICDELNRYQQYQAAMQFVNQNNSNNGLNVGSNHHQLHQQQQQQLNANFSDVRNNLWKILPTHMQQQHTHTTATTTTAAAAASAVVNSDFNNNHNNNNSSNKKPQKRYNSAKNEKYPTVKHCVFCENNNEPEAVVKSHAVRDSLGRVLCPKLRTYICPICKASGDLAHTVKYCPQKPIFTMEDALKAQSFRLAKGTFYKQQMKV